MSVKEDGGVVLSNPLLPFQVEAMNVSGHLDSWVSCWCSYCLGLDNSGATALCKHNTILIIGYVLAFLYTGMQAFGAIPQCQYL